MKIKNLILFVFLLIFSFGHITFSKEPVKFIEEITSAASSILDSEDTKEDKILKLKKIAENSVDIIGIGLYSLGKHRKTINSDQKKIYNQWFLF